MSNKPKLGDTTTCKHCGGKIQYLGLGWRHIVADEIIVERHPAEPATAVQPVRTSRIDAAILQPPVQYQTESDGDALWA